MTNGAGGGGGGHGKKAVNGPSKKPKAKARKAPTRSSALVPPSLRKRAGQ